MKNLCKHKDDGGMGLRDLHYFNRALLAKSAWRVCIKRNEICAKDLSVKHFPAGDVFFSYSKKKDFSWSWKSISLEMEFVKKIVAGI